MLYAMQKGIDLLHLIRRERANLQSDVIFFNL
jgi:hypothetical protein